MKRPTRVTRGSPLVTSFAARRVGRLDIHRAELEHLDQLVVEAIALLLEENRPAAVEPDRDRDDRHHGERGEQCEAADDLVEQPFHHDVPVGDRAVEHVEHRHRADVGVGARAEPQLVGVRREADVDRQHPELLEHLQDARLGRDRQREDHEVDAGAAREFDEVVDRAELLQAGAGGGRAVVAAVVEHADQAHVRLALALQRGDEMLARIAAADHDRAAVEPAFAGPAAHDAVQKQAQAIEREQADAVVAREPEARIHAAELARRTRRRRPPERRSTTRR